MTVFKCKMCGGDIILNEEKTFYTCEYCGSSMTLPKVSDEQKAVLYNRGNHFRRIGEFDKALAIYENIVREDDTDAEAHWCCVLCRFGIEYVEDPTTYEFLPTCHRASYDSILEDVDYLAALEHSEGITRRQYQKDAAKISEVQKGILATSQNEEPFDVFICYKESDDTTKERTRDSVDAQEIYYQLTQEGFRVFFSRITLEEKAGTEYEPYIFAALNSAKVMIVVGSQPEYFNAVWVKNEWSRFISLMKKDRNKLLIPCYKEMDPYDLPEQLSILQSYDMTKIGFTQDLIRGVKKVVNAAEPQASVKEVVVNGSTINTEPLLKRAFMALEDKEWDKADDFCEQVLNQDPENVQAYLGKLMVEKQVCTQEQLADCDVSFETSNNYKKIIRFGDEAIASTMREYIDHINEQNKNKRLDRTYNLAVSFMKSADSEYKYKKAADIFKTILPFRDSETLIKECMEKAGEIREKSEEKANNEKKKIDAIAKALNDGEGEEKESSLEEKLASSKERIEHLVSLRSEFDELITQASKLQQEKETIGPERVNLCKKRLKLGIFSVKEKKNIDEELVWLSNKEKELVDAIEMNSRQRCNCNTKDEIEKEIEKERLAVSELEELINNKHTNLDIVYSYEEALITYLSDPSVTNAVNAILYPTISQDSIVFGRYMQKEYGSPEPIEWQVLKRENERMLVVSKYALDNQRYNKRNTNVSWESCTLRKWLNDIFLNEAFNLKEQNCIIDSVVPADTVSSGINTNDKLFLLSVSEVKLYLDSRELRRCAPTEYAKVQGAGSTKAKSDTMVDGRATCWWCLRSPGIKDYLIISVDVNGDVVTQGGYVNLDDNAVRPAMWIKIDRGESKKT